MNQQNNNSANSNNSAKVLRSLSLPSLPAIDEFKKAYPELGVDQLKPTFPTTLEKVNLKNKQMAQIDLHPAILSALCGSIFGDGGLSLNKGYVNARFQMRHSTVQTDWFMWKSFAILGEFINETSISFQEVDGFQKNSLRKDEKGFGKWHVATKVDTKLTSLRNIIYDGNKKTLKRFWLNHMNNYFLMTLWLDDGSLNGNRQGVFSLNSTPPAQAKILAEYISTVWGVQCNVGIVRSKITKTNREPVAITIANIDELEKFIRIIAPIVPVKSMLYKICIYHEDSSRLQRWTSELKTLVRPEWHEYLDTYYAYLGKKND